MKGFRSVVKRLAEKVECGSSTVFISYVFFLRPTECLISVHLLTNLMPAAAAQVHSHDMWLFPSPRTTQNTQENRAWSFFLRFSF